MVSMPTVLRHGPYRFFFYSGDRDEPPHVHQAVLVGGWNEFFGH